MSLAEIDTLIRQLYIDIRHILEATLQIELVMIAKSNSELHLRAASRPYCLDLILWKLLPRQMPGLL